MIRGSAYLAAAVCACALSATPSAARPAERYEGTAYLRGTDRLAYRETDWLFTRDGVGRRLTLYRCADGRPFARKEVRDIPSGIAPDFEFRDARDGYREGVRTVDGTRQIFVQQSVRAPTIVRNMPADSAGGVIDAGFDAFIRAHWQELAAGRSQRIPFLVPDRFEFLNFRIAAVSGGSLDGRPTRELKMTLATWYGFALPSIDVAYDPHDRWLAQYQGIGNIRDVSGHNEDVRIEFPLGGRRDPVSDDEIDRAMTEPLSASCGG